MHTWDLATLTQLHATWEGKWLRGPNLDIFISKCFHICQVQACVLLKLYNPYIDYSIAKCHFFGGVQWKANKILMPMREVYPLYCVYTAVYWLTSLIISVTELTSQFSQIMGSGADAVAIALGGVSEADSYLGILVLSSTFTWKHVFWLLFPMSSAGCCRPLDCTKALRKSFPAAVWARLQMNCISKNPGFRQKLKKYIIVKHHTSPGPFKDTEKLAKPPCFRGPSLRSIQVDSL